MSLPKVLIIGQPFNNTGGGITLTNLFKGWDRDKLAVACVGAMANTDQSICNNYYRLGEKERKGMFPFNYLQTKYSSGPVKFNEIKKQNLEIPKPSLRTRLIMNYFFPLLKYMGISHSLFKTQLSPEFCDWINHFKPNVLYAQASSREGILFCSTLSAHLKIPMIFHMMDDWPSIISDKGLFKKYWNKQIDLEFRDLLNKADKLMSIGETMSTEYKKRYDKTFIPFQNPINIEFWKKCQRHSYELNNSPTILYAGRIGLGISSSVEAVAQAVQQLNGELKMTIKLILHTDIKPPWTGNYACVEQKPLIPHNDLPKLFSEADFLLLPYDFSEKSVKYIGYSMPTKAPEYMISGTPIIIFAPEKTAIVEYARKYELAKVITENKISRLSLAIRELIEKRELRQRMAQRAIQTAELNHNSIQVTNHFRDVIKSVVPES